MQAQFGIRALAKAFLPFSTDTHRKNEIRQLLYLADEEIGKNIGWRCPAMLMLARADIICERDHETNTRTDIDGLAGYFNNGKLYWLIMETKKSHKHNGEKQLREKFLPLLQNQISVSEIKLRSNRGDKNWFLIVESPVNL